MGCDIHAWAEVRRPDGAWDLVTERRFTNPYWSESAPPSWWEPMIAAPYEGRNYHLFALLAGVRNYDDIEPLADPKGVPDDASSGYLHHVDEWDGDGHSHTWFTLSDLLSVPWDTASLERSGVMAEGDYIRLLRTGEWETCSLSISGPGIVTLEPEAYEQMMGAGRAYFDREGLTARDPSKRYFVRARWREAYTKVFSRFVERTIPEMRKLADERGVGHDDVRFVCFFDN